MSKTLANKRVVITDADAFMGPAIAELFAEEGADLVVDRRDLRVPSAAADLVRGAGRVDVLVANLSATYSGSLTQDITDSEMMEMFERLVFPLHRLTRAVLPQMLERRAGKIIVVGSAAGLRGQPRRQTYSAARGAQQAYVRSVGVEVAPFNIQVNATGQSFVENPSYFPPAYIITDEFKERMQQVPASRLSTGREAASLIRFLAGPDSDFFVGQVFPYAGGWVV
jgi:2-keto-3-deoxy-L-fuconate dehydrogenase